MAASRLARRRLAVLAAPLLAAVLAVAGCATSPIALTDRPPSTSGPAVATSSPAPGPTDPAPPSPPSPSNTLPPASTPQPASSTPAPTRSAPRSATITMSGDLLWHDGLWLTAAEDRARTGTPGRYDFDPMFAALKPVISQADLAICHEEVPFAGKGAAPRGYPVFAAPAEVAPWVASMGWDLCTTDSNHSLDQGFQGLVRTKDYFAEAGVLASGTSRTEAERNTPVIYTTGAGVKVAVVGGTYGTNGIPLPRGKEWSVSMLDADDLVAQAKRAKEAGADIVLAQMHGGDEYVVQPNAQQVRVAAALTASPYVDLVYGQHVHVVQPITMVNAKWVAYGLGNAIGHHLTDQPRAYEGITTRFTFTEQAAGGFAVTRAEYLPTYWNNRATGPVRVVLLSQALASGTGDLARYQVALDSTRRAVNLLGPTPGLVES